jgi:hypothetical protein
MVIRAILCSAADVRTHALFRAESQSFLSDRRNRLTIFPAVVRSIAGKAEVTGSILRLQPRIPRICRLRDMRRRALAFHGFCGRGDWRLWDQAGHGGFARPVSNAESPISGICRLAASGLFLLETGWYFLAVGAAERGRGMGAIALAVSPLCWVAFYLRCNL